MPHPTKHAHDRAQKHINETQRKHLLSVLEPLSGKQLATLQANQAMFDQLRKAFVKICGDADLFNEWLKKEEPQGE